MDKVVQVFKALSDETRLKILIILLHRRICAKGVARHLNISEAAVSQHLKTLRDAGIVVGEKSGYYVHYNLQKEILFEIIKFIEQMNSDYSKNICRWGMNMPEDCKVECKASKNNCCQININKNREV
jgi:ArsR family transcriptional regulator